MSIQQLATLSRNSTLPGNTLLLQLKRRDIGSSCGEEHRRPEQSVNRLIQEGEVDGVATLNKAINEIRRFVSQRHDFIDFLHQDINAVLHAKLEKATVE